MPKIERSVGEAIPFFYSSIETSSKRTAGCLVSFVFLRCSWFLWFLLVFDSLPNGRTSAAKRSAKTTPAGRRLRRRRRPKISPARASRRRRRRPAHLRRRPGRKRRRQKPTTEVSSSGSTVAWTEEWITEFYRVTFPSVAVAAVKKPKKGMATAKQRLGKILKIHKMAYQ